MLLYMNQRVITSSHNNLSRLTFKARKTIPLIIDMTDNFCYRIDLIYVTVKSKPELLDSVEFSLSVKVIFDKIFTQLMFLQNYKGKIHSDQINQLCI